MKKLILIALIFCCIQVHAQSDNIYTYTTKAISIGPELSVPFTNSNYKIGFGGSVKGEWPISEEVAFIGSGGVTKLYYKDAIIKDATDLFVPVKAGARYFFAPEFYTNLELGVSFGPSHYNTFAYGFGLGYLYRIKKHQGIDFGVQGERWGKNLLRQFAFRVGYRFD